jgi:hypothetical protein
MPGTIVLEMSERDHELLHQLIVQLQQMTSDHENRIRFLERYVNLIIGGATVVYWVIQQFR